MNRNSLIFFLLSVLIAGASCVYIRQTPEGYLIGSTVKNYALYSPVLEQRGWKTVLVSGEDVLIYKPDSCDFIKTNFDSLSSEEKELINNLKNQLAAIQRSFNVAHNSNVVALGGTHKDEIDAIDIGKAYTTIGDSYMVKKPNFPNNVAAVIFYKDVIIFSYPDGQITMKPNACLDATEHKIVLDLKIERITERTDILASTLKSINRSIVDYGEYKMYLEVALQKAESRLQRVEGEIRSLNAELRNQGSSSDPRRDERREQHLATKRRLWADKVDDMRRTNQFKLSLEEQKIKEKIKRFEEHMEKWNSERVSEQDDEIKKFGRIFDSLNEQKLKLAEEFAKF